MKGTDLTNEEAIQIYKKLFRLYKEENLWQYVKTKHKWLNNKSMMLKMQFSTYLPSFIIASVWDVFYNYYVNHKHCNDASSDLLSSISASFVLIKFANDFLNNTDSKTIKILLEENINREFAYLHERLTFCNQQFLESIVNDEFIVKNEVVKKLKEFEKKYNIPKDKKICAFFVKK